MVPPQPIVGEWFLTAEGHHFEVVAFDPEEGSVGVQFYDGTIEEYDADSWNQLGITPIAPPEDWTGSLDVCGDDYGVDLDRPAGDLHIDPLENLPEMEDDLL